MWHIPQPLIDCADDERTLQFVMNRTKDPEKFLSRIRYLNTHPRETSREEIELQDGMVLDRYSAPVIGGDGHLERMNLDVPRHHGSTAAGIGVAASESRGRSRQPNQERIPRQHEPRDSHPDERHPRHDRTRPRHAARSRAARVSRTWFEQSADVLLAVINDILDFSKIEAGKLELEAMRFTLREAVGTMVKPLALRAHEKGLELICWTSPADVPDSDSGDADRLRQILVNLIGNAVKFTERAKSSVRSTSESKAGDRASFCISLSRDTGIGIPLEKQNAIFRSRFSQADGSITRALRRHRPRPRLFRRAWWK